MRSGILAFSFAAALFMGLHAPVRGREAEPQKPTASLAAMMREVCEAVLAHHIEPPARQQMVLAGLRGAYATAGQPAPRDLASKVSSALSNADLDALIAGLPPEVRDRAESKPEEALQAMLTGVRGHLELIPARHKKVNDQVAGNLYVGIHVALGLDEQKRPILFDVRQGGPADRAGMKKGDILDTVDGDDISRLPLLGLIDKLRGPQGSTVAVGYHSPPDTTPRKATMTRGVLPQKTVLGPRDTPGDQDFFLDDSDSQPIAYIKLNSLFGSTPQELRAALRKIEERKPAGLILDLRPVAQSNLHAAVLTADELIESGTICLAKWVDHVETFAAEPDAGLRGVPLAVIVSESIGTDAAVVASALKHARGALIVGPPCLPEGSIEGSYPVLDGSYFLELPAGTLEQADGKPLGVPLSKASELAREGPATDPALIRSAGLLPDVPVGTARKVSPGTPIPPFAAELAKRVGKYDATVQKAAEALKGRAAARTTRGAPGQ